MAHWLRQITPLAGAALIATLAGCLLKPWDRRDRPTPWIAANTRAVEYIRIHEGIGGGSTSDREWRDDRQRRVSITDTRDGLDTFMHENGMFNPWPNSQSTGPFGVERFAPYRFVVISISPTVILMIPFDFGPRGDRSDNDVVYVTEAAACMRSNYMINRLECNISTVYAPGMSWFSHDLKQRPTLIEWQDGRAELLIGDDALILKQDANVVVTERETRKQ